MSHVSGVRSSVFCFWLSNRLVVQYVLVPAMQIVPGFRSQKQKTDDLTPAVPLRFGDQLDCS